MQKRLDEICAEPCVLGGAEPAGHVAGIYPASVYRCDDPDQAQRRLGEIDTGYVYQRDAHPNADLLAEKCRRLHDADWGLVTSSGMAALSLATLTLLEAGDRVVLSEGLYGRTTQQLVQQWSRLGVQATLVDVTAPEKVAAALSQPAKLVVVETLTNPMLRVASIAELANAAHTAGGQLLVDNTFATPAVCHPLKLGADLVLESLSKMINGHSDVMLGALLGCGHDKARYQDVLSVWGLASSPFDAWLACRGAQTLHLRMERACGNAASLAGMLEAHPVVTAVSYPGLSTHPDHELARRQFEQHRSGSIVTFDLPGGRPAATALMAALQEVPFCPSLGEVSSTISHPASTSHRRVPVDQRAQLGIGEGTMRFSVGTESSAWLLATVDEALKSVAAAG